MAPLTTSQEYQAIREAIQYLTTLGADSMPKPTVIQVDGLAVTFGASVTLTYLQARERELANRLCNRNRRKRTSPDFSYSS
jgi:hypothetical protein